MRRMRASLVTATAVFAALALASIASPQKEAGPDEVFRAVDPYTRGESEALHALGIVSLAPFVWTPGKSTTDVARDLGGISFVWIETAHFKLGSSLTTYDLQSDEREREKLERELDALKKKLPRSTALPRRKLDPWLRAHLYAQRLEAIYAEFCERFGLCDADFPAEPMELSDDGTHGNAYFGVGPYLGQKEKFTILLTQRRSTLGRYTQATFGQPFDDHYRFPLRAGGMFFGASAEAMAERTRGIDAGMHCAVANGVSQILAAGLRDSSYAVPVWFREGLGHWFSRRTDPRWNLYGGGTESTRRREENSWAWERRVRGLVEHGEFVPWAETLSWMREDEISERMHMVVWSRVDFLMQRPGSDLHAWILGTSDRLYQAPPERMAALLRERQAKAFQAAFKCDVSALEAEWKAWVAASYADK